MSWINSTFRLLSSYKIIWLKFIISSNLTWQTQQYSEQEIFIKNRNIFMIIFISKSITIWTSLQEHSWISFVISNCWNHWFWLISVEFVESSLKISSISHLNNMESTINEINMSIRIINIIIKAIKIITRRFILCFDFFINFFPSSIFPRIFILLIRYFCYFDTHFILQLIVNYE